MKRTWVLAGVLAAGLAGLGGAAYAASDHDGTWRGGPGHMRGENPRDYGWSGQRWRDDDRRGDGPRDDGWRGRGGDCGPGMGRGRGRGMEHGERGMGHGMGRHGFGHDGMHGMRRDHDHGYDRDRDGRGPRHGTYGGRGRMSAFDPAELDSVKKEIGVTAAQEQAWTKYAGAIKEAADARKARREGIDRDAMRKMSPEDHRKFRDSMWEQRRKEQDAVRAAVDELVKSFDEKQTAVAREILPGYAFGPGMRGAGMGMGRHRHFDR
jgi:hypothetical protein